MSELFSTVILSVYPQCLKKFLDLIGKILLLKPSLITTTGWISSAERLGCCCLQNSVCVTKSSVLASRVLVFLNFVVTVLTFRKIVDGILNGAFWNVQISSYLLQLVVSFSQLLLDLESPFNFFELRKDCQPWYKNSYSNRLTTSS